MSSINYMNAVPADGRKTVATAIRKVKQRRAFIFAENKNE